MKLQPGQWFMWDLDRQLPDKLTVYSGDVFNRKVVCTINRQQALALIRWHGHKGMYYTYMTAHGRIYDVRVCGDIDAWYGDQPLLTEGPKMDQQTKAQHDQWELSQDR